MYHLAKIVDNETFLLSRQMSRWVSAKSTKHHPAKMSFIDAEAYIEEKRMNGDESIFLIISVKDRERL